VLRRLVATLPIAVIFVSVAAFFVPELTGVNAAEAVLRAHFSDPNPDPQVTRALAEQFGFDKPILQRFALFSRHAAVGDFGNSYVSRASAWGTAWGGFKVSLVLSSLSVCLSVAMGCLVGITAAAGSVSLKRSAEAVCLLGASLPPHVLGPFTVLVFGVWLRVLPTGGWGSPQFAILPLGVLSLGPIASIASIVRAEMVDALQAAFVRTAKAKGLHPLRVLRHAFAVARQGVVAMGSTLAAGLLSGALLVEILFSIPGLGRVMVTAFRNSDIPVVQASLVIAVVFSIIVSVLADVISERTDPRIRIS
jgi:ABC-type dipeptide/oligopeptide/nickel transport system permease component